MALSCIHALLCAILIVSECVFASPVTIDTKFGGYKTDNSVYPSTLSITCRMNTTLEAGKSIKAENILAFLVSKDGDTPVASIIASCSPEFRPPHVHSDGKGMTIELVDVSRRDSGLYACSVIYLDGNGHAHEETSSQSVNYTAEIFRKGQELAKPKIYLEGKQVSVDSLWADYGLVVYRVETPVFLATQMRRVDNEFIMNVQLKVGSWLTITGIARKAGDYFAIDFLMDTSRNSGVAFHYNPRFVGRITDYNTTIMNSQLNGSWGEEEGRGVGPFPFRRGTMFRVDVFVLKSGYKVFANGAPHLEFEHRVPPTHVSQLKLQGHADYFQPEIHE